MECVSECKIQNEVNFENNCMSSHSTLDVLLVSSAPLGFKHHDGNLLHARGVVIPDIGQHFTFPRMAHVPLVIQVKCCHIMK